MQQRGHGREEESQGQGPEAEGHSDSHHTTPIPGSPNGSPNGGTTSPGSPDPTMDAILGNQIFGVPSVLGSGTMKTCRDGGNALQRQTGDHSHRSDVPNGPPASNLPGIGSQFDPLESSQPTILELDSEDADQGAVVEQVVDPAALAKRRLDEMENELRERSLKPLPGPFSGPEFYIPLDVLDSLITRKAVRAVLPFTAQDLSFEKLDELAQVIAGKRKNDQIQEFRKIFAILILIGKTDSIVDFVEVNITDDRLPLIKVGDDRMFDLALADLETEGEVITLFKKPEWEREHIEGFEAHQWETLAPFFSRGKEPESCVQRYELSVHRPLPFKIIPEVRTENNGRGIRKPSGSTSGNSSSLLGSMIGGYSEVLKVTIHSAHHSLHSYRVKGNPRLIFHLLA